MKTPLKARTREGEKRKIKPIKPTKPNLRKLRTVFALSVQGLNCLKTLAVCQFVPHVNAGPLPADTPSSGPLVRVC
jgi:hypothetical protein